MNRGRRIAFDFGEVRIGVAVTDQEAILAIALENLEAQSPDLREKIDELINEYSPKYFVVGNPQHLSGAPSAKAESVKVYCALLCSLSTLPIYLVDERLSTVSAARDLRDSGISAKAGKKKIDGAAAVTILESALAAEKNSGEPSKLRFLCD